MAGGRSRIVALLLSGTFPGLGQFYNRQPVKGTLFVTLGVLLTWLIGRAMPTDVIDVMEHGISARLGVEVVALLVVSLWSVIDAARG